jgi:peptidoglycan-associated lipoprotein
MLILRRRNLRSTDFILYFLLLLLLSFFLALLLGCPNKTPVAKTPPPPSLPAPAATIEANPAQIQPGQPVTITWKTENATDVSIEPLGAVAPSGTQTVSPNQSTTYRLVAKGAGGVKESDVDVTVMAAAQVRAPSAEESIPETGNIRYDVFFDTDDFAIRPDQLSTIKSDADLLKHHPEMHVLVEGHCDELGSTEYNLALGDLRAAEVKFALLKAGVKGNRIRTISYGKERPLCEEPTEACFKSNRRAHIVPDTQR